MLTTKLKSLLAAAAVMASVGIAAEAQAAALKVHISGQLVGANGVDVNGTLYDVAFANSSCISVFGGCDQLSDFAFNTQADAIVAAQALLDQVFIDDALGDFDSDPTLTEGCFGISCGAFIPYGFFDGLVGIVRANNNPLADVDTISELIFTLPATDLSFGPESVYALFVPADDDGLPEDPGTPGTDVPAPGALLLFGFGLAGLGFAVRTDRRLAWRAAGPRADDAAYVAIR